MQQVEPRETRAPRLRPLAVLPLFMDLAGKRAVVAGRGEAMVWKAELLAAAGAHVRVYASQVCEELRALGAASPPPRIEILARGWRPDDLTGAAIAVGALCGGEARAFAAAARRLGVPVNVIDTPEYSTFSFGAIVNRSPVVLGISTAGAAPVLAQALRGRLEALLNPALGQWAAAARKLRGRIAQQIKGNAARRQRWWCFADRAVRARSAPRVADLWQLAGPARPSRGKVTLVGAGPGDPELLTLKALRALQSADSILYDRLVSTEVLELARREARRILVGKCAGGASCRQQEVSALMLKLARSGQHVVRLKGGDPMIFARAAEEIEACRRAQIPLDVIPGITAASGVAAECQIPLTDRRCARRLTFVTGTDQDGCIPEHDWSALADPWATSVFYMGARTFAALLPKLLAAGLDPDTPALLAASATTARRHYLRCPVLELVDNLENVEAAAPCLIMIGRAMQRHERDRQAHARGPSTKILQSRDPTPGPGSGERRQAGFADRRQSQVLEPAAFASERQTAVRAGRGRSRATPR